MNLLVCVSSLNGAAILFYPSASFAAVDSGVSRCDAPAHLIQCSRCSDPESWHELSAPKPKTIAFLSTHHYEKSAYSDISL